MREIFYDQLCIYKRIFITWRLRTWWEENLWPHASSCVRINPLSNVCMWTGTPFLNFFEERGNSLGCKRWYSLRYHTFRFLPRTLCTLTSTITQRRNALERVSKLSPTMRLRRRKKKEGRKRDQLESDERINKNNFFFTCSNLYHRVSISNIFFFFFSLFPLKLNFCQMLSLFLFSLIILPSSIAFIKSFKLLRAKIVARISFFSHDNFSSTFVYIFIFYIIIFFVHASPENNKLLVLIENFFFFFVERALIYSNHLGHLHSLSWGCDNRK